ALLAWRHGRRKLEGYDTVIRWIPIALLVSVAVADSGKEVYSEAFRKGPSRITEGTVEVSLAPEHARQDFKIMDAAGQERYILRSVPDIPPGDTRILGWFVRLVDVRHRLYESILPTSQDLVRDHTQAWWLDGRQFSKIPLQARRVFKVEQFYCVVQ